MKAFLKRLPPFETAVLVLAIIALVGIKFLREQAPSAPLFDSFSTFDATHGGYRAWFELLQREGVAVEQFQQRPAFLDRAQFATLVWAEPLPFDPSQTYNTEADISALEDWVKAGGHFVYVGHDDDAAKRHVLGLPLTKTVKTTGPVRPLPSAWLSAAGVARSSWSTKLRWTTPKHTTTLIADKAGPLVVRYTYGHGDVIAVVDETPFQNAHLGEGDDARLAYALTRAARPGAVVAFDEAVHGHVVPEHWWEIVPRSFLIAVALAALALLIAFTGAAIRLGPPLLPIERDATSVEFIDSFAALLERGRAAHKALVDAADSTIRIVAAALGLPNDAPRRAFVERIDDSELRGDFAALVQIVSDPQSDTSSLVRGVALAQRLRKEFETHGRSRR